jgi:O-antigen ligase
MLIENKRILAFTSILFISSLFYTGLVLDFTHAPRFFLLSALLSLYTLIFVQPSMLASRPTAVSIAYILLCLWSFSSALWAINPHEVWFVSAKWVCVAAIFHLAISLYRYGIAMERSVSLLAMALASISVGLVLLQWREIDLYGISMGTESPLYYITSTSSHKNLVSSFLFFLLPFILVVRFPKRSIISYLRVLITVGIIGAQLILKTRTVWLATCFALVLIGILVYRIYAREMAVRTRRIIIATAGLVLAVSVYICIDYLPRTNLANTDSIQERILIWHNTMLMIQDHLLMGVGAGNWQIHFPQYSLEGIWRCDELNVSFQRPHNDFLWIMSELGVVGILLQLFVWIGALYRGFKRLGQLSLPHQQLQLGVFISFYIAGAIVLFMDFPIERAEHSIFMALGTAYLFTRVDTNIAATTAPPNSYTGQCLKYLIILILCLATYIAFQRIRGEYFTKQIYTAKIRKDSRSVLRNVHSARSFAYSLDPVSLPVIWYAGTAFIQENNVDAALGCFKLAHTAHPYQRNVLNDLATGYLAKNNPKLAEKYYQEAIRISPRFDEPALNLVALYIMQDQLDMACRWDSVLTHDSPRRTQLKQEIILLEQCSYRADTTNVVLRQID